MSTAEQWDLPRGEAWTVRVPAREKHAHRDVRMQGIGFAVGVGFIAGSQGWSTALLGSVFLAVVFTLMGDE